MDMGKIFEEVEVIYGDVQPSTGGRQWRRLQEVTVGVYVFAGQLLPDDGSRL